LVYACVACNLTKGHAEVPDPCDALLAKHVVIHHDGRMEAQTKEAAKLIDKLLLNSENCRTFRRRWIGPQPVQKGKRMAGKRMHHARDHSPQRAMVARTADLV
jgi:hypothetical protein